jgi:hypothetical protein
MITETNCLEQDPRLNMVEEYIGIVEKSTDPEWIIIECKLKDENRVNDTEESK